MMVATITHGQSIYYNESKEIHGKDYTYTCDVKNGVFITLVNNETVYRGCKQIVTSSNEEVKKEEAPFLKNDDKSHKQLLAVCNSILSQYFTTEAEKKHTTLILNVYINPQTGRIADVKYCFSTNRKYAQLSPDVFRELELCLKQNVLFEPTAEGRKANYIFRQTVYYQK